MSTDQLQKLVARRPAMSGTIEQLVGKWRNRGTLSATPYERAESKIYQRCADELEAALQGQLAHPDELHSQLRCIAKQYGITDGENLDKLVEWVRFNFSVRLWR